MKSTFTKMVLIVFVFLLSGLNLFGQVSGISYTGTDIIIEVSDAIYGDDITPSSDDPLSGTIIWYVTNEQDGSATKAKVLEGTHYYKTDPDTLLFTSNSSAQMIAAFAINDPNFTQNLIGSYNLKLNDINHSITQSNIVDLDYYYNQGIVKKIPYSGTQVEIIVSGSIYGDDITPSADDPLPGVIFWYVSNEQDGSATNALVLEGTHYYKTEPDSFSFNSNSAVDYLYAFTIHDPNYGNNLTGSYQVKVNGIDYLIDTTNILNLVPLTPVEDDIKVAKEFNLSQNYPNPFNPFTTIKYQIPEPSFVSLKVYDILGNKISTLINEEKSAGNYDLAFDGTKLSSGIYFYRLEVGDFIESKKMILLK